MRGRSGGGRRTLGREREERYGARLVALCQGEGESEGQQGGSDERRPDLRGEVAEGQCVAVVVIGAVCVTSVTRRDGRALVVRGGMRVGGRDSLVVANLDQLAVLAGGVRDEEQVKEPRALEGQEAQRDQ